MRRNNLLIGITGGIGAGKSIVCSIFKILNVPVYDADSRARYILNHNTQLREELLKLFGKNAYNDQGLNNTWIAKHVFSDKEKLEELNSLVHPKVGEDFQAWVESKSEFPYLIKEAALLYESGSYKDLSRIIVVTAPEKLRIERILARDSHRTVDQVKDIISRQLPEQDKIDRADFLIKNDDQHLVVPQVLDIHNQLLKLSGIT